MNETTWPPTCRFGTYPLIDPVQTLDVQPDMTFEQLVDRHRRHSPDCPAPRHPRQPQTRRSEAKPHWWCVSVLSNCWEGDASPGKPSVCGGAAGSCTVTRSPPAGRGVRVSVPLCAWVMLLTIARPRPTPAWSVRMRSVPR